MFNISDYLDKFKKLGQNDSFVKEQLVRVLREVVGVEVDVSRISLKNGEVFLNVSPALKNSVFIKKQLILNKLKEYSGKNTLDIR